jgi:hypothetical protein
LFPDKIYTLLGVFLFSILAVRPILSRAPVVRQAENSLIRFTERRVLSVWVLFLAVIGLRLLLLPALNVPVPGIHDRTGHQQHETYTLFFLWCPTGSLKAVITWYSQTPWTDKSGESLVIKFPMVPSPQPISSTEARCGISPASNSDRTRVRRPNMKA